MVSPAHIECAGMGLRIDAPGHAAHDFGTDADRSIDHGAAGMHAVVGITPAPDHRNRRPGGEGNITKGNKSRGGSGMS